MDKQNEGISFKDAISIAKEHFSILAGCSTVLLSSFLALINVINIINDKIVLNYWGISADFLASPKKDFLYQVFLAFVYFVLAILFNLVLYAFFSEYYHDGTGIHFYQYANKIILKEIKDEQKRRERKEKEKVSDITIEKKEKQNNNTAFNEERMQKLNDDAEKIRKEQKKRKKTKQAILYSKMLFAFTIFAFSGLLTYTYFFPDSILFNMLISVLLSFVVCVFFALLNYFKEKKKNRKYHEMVFGSQKTDDAVFEEANDSIHQKKSFDNIQMDSLKKFIAISSIGLILILCSTLFITFYQINNQKTFYVLSDENNQYVYIYDSNGGMVFEEAEINGKELIVYTSKQLIKDRTDIVLQRMTFKTVTKK